MLSKKIWLHRLLNKKHPRYIRLFIAISVAGLIALATGRVFLSQNIFKAVFHKTDLKNELRKLAWICRNSWLRPFIPKDPMFDFCETATTGQLQSFQSMLRPHIDKGDISLQLDYLKIRIYQFHMHSHEALRREISNSIDAIYKSIENRNVQYFSRTTASQKQNPEFTSEVTKRASNAELMVALQDFEAIFPKSQYQWFVIAGTFLGAVRENNFIKWDLDLDVGMYINKTDPNLILKLISSSGNFEIAHTSTSNDAGLMQPVLSRLLHKSGVNVDLFWHQEENGYSLHATKSILWKNSIFELELYNIDTAKVFGPKNADLYLTETYGNWHKPVSAYNYHIDMSSLTGQNNLYGAEYLLRRWYNFGKISEAEKRIIRSMILSL